MTPAEVLALVGAVASSLSLLGLILLRRQIVADHERARRTKAVELMEYWTQHTAQHAPAFAIRRLVEGLSSSECSCINEPKAFAIDAVHKSALALCFDGRFPGSMPDEQQGRLPITEQQAVHIRTQLIQFLNSLEAVCAAWRHHVADRDIIEEEFGTIVAQKPSAFALEEFRKVTGSYPSIDEFTKAVRAKHARRINKTPVG